MTFFAGAQTLLLAAQCAPELLQAYIDEVEAYTANAAKQAAPLH